MKETNNGLKDFISENQAGIVLTILLIIMLVLILIPEKNYEIGQRVCRQETNLKYPNYDKEKNACYKIICDEIHK